MRTGVLLGCGLLLVGCASGAGDLPASPPLTRSADLLVTVPAVHVGAHPIQASTAEVLVIPANRAQAVLGRMSLPASQFGQAVTLPLTLEPCSSAPGQPCQAVLVARFLSAATSVVDSVESSPFAIAGGGRTTAPTIQPRATVRLATADTALRLSFSQPARVRIDAIDAYGALLPFRSFTWISANPAVATVDSAGVVTARAPGRTTITASREGQSLGVPVHAPAVERLQLIAPVTTVMARLPLKLSTTIVTAPGVSSAVRVRSSDSTIAVVTPDLQVITRRDGRVLLTAVAQLDTTVTSTVTLDVRPFEAVTTWRGLVSADQGRVPNTVNGVWGADEQHILAIGCGFVSTYDGTSWRADRQQIPFCGTGITGTSRTDVYAVSNQVWHFNGSAWRVLSPSFPATLYSAGIVDGDLVAVGDRGLVIRGRGSSWTTLASGTNVALRRIATDGRTAVIIGDSGVVLRVSGTRVEPLPVPGIAPQWHDVLVRSATDIYLAGADFAAQRNHLIQRWDGERWQEMPVDAGSGCCQMRMLFNTRDTLRALADNGRIFRLDRRGWALEFTGNFSHVFNSWSGGTTVMVGGHSSTTIVRRGGTWTRLSANPSYHVLWAASPSFMVAGGSGTGIDWYDGVRWTAMAGEVDRSFNGLWGSAPNDIWAVGWPDTFMHYDGTAWRQRAPSTTAAAQGIWGIHRDSVWAVFSNGDVMRYNGTTWQTIYRTRTPLHTIGGAGSRHLIVAGNDGRVWQFNGRLWLQEDSGVDEPIRRLWVVDSTLAYAVTANSILERNNGLWRSWSYPGANFNWVHGSGARDVYVGGGCSIPILRFDGERWQPHQPSNGETQCSASGWFFRDGGAVVGKWNRYILVGTSPLGGTPGLPR